MIGAEDIEREMRVDEAKKEREERIKRYIFDPSRVHRRVPFAQFQLDKHLLGVGVFLPRMEDVLDKKGEVVGQKQVERAVIITTEPNLYEISHGEVKELKVGLESIPPELQRRWSLQSMEQFLRGDTTPPNPRQLYDTIKARYEQYLYFNPAKWYNIHALWDIGTYFAQLFHAYPYIELRGPPSSGKNKVMGVSSLLTFNATPIMASPTEATLFRETDGKRPTTYLDECENLWRINKGHLEHDGRVEVLNAGYAADGTVPRQEPTGKKGQYQTVIYHAYSPKMLSSVAGLHGATETRAIVHISTRAPTNDERGNRELERQEPGWQSLRDKLYLFMLHRWQDVFEQYNLLLNQNPTGLRNRDMQLWRPLLAVARVIGEDVYAQTVQDAEFIAGLAQNLSLGEDDFDGKLLGRFYDLLRGGAGFVANSELAEVFPEERKPHGKTIARHLDNYGLRDYRDQSPSGKERGYRISQEVFEKLVTPYYPSLFSSVVSDTSDEERIVEEKKESDKDSKSDERSKRPTKISDESDGKDDSDAGYCLSALSKADLLAAMRQSRELAPLEWWQSLFPGDPVERWLAELKAVGEVEEPRAGYWRALL